MFVARLNAAAFKQPSPMHTPVIGFNREAPVINQQRDRKVYAYGIKPRKLTKDLWFYVHELDLVIGRVKDKKQFSGYCKVTLDNDLVFTITDTMILRGCFLKRSLSGKMFRFDHM